MAKTNRSDEQEKVFTGRKFLTGLKKAGFWLSSVIWFPLNFVLGIALAPVLSVLIGIDFAKDSADCCKTVGDSRLLTALKCTFNFLFGFLFHAVTISFYGSPYRMIKDATKYSKTIGTKEKAEVGFFGVIFSAIRSFFTEAKTTLRNLNIVSKETPKEDMSTPKNEDKKTDDGNSELLNQQLNQQQTEVNMQTIEDEAKKQALATNISPNMSQEPEEKSNSDQSQSNDAK